MARSCMPDTVAYTTVSRQSVGALGETVGYYYAITSLSLVSLGSSARLQLRSLAGWPIVEPGRWWPERVLAGHFPVIDDNDSSTEKRWFDATKRSLRHPSSDDQLMNRSRGVQVS